MAHLNSESTVTLTMPQLLTVLAAIVGGGWLLFSWTTSSLREDVGVIRQSIVALQGSDKEGAVRIREVDLKLVEQISGLRITIASLDSRFANFDSKIDGLNKNIDALAGRLGEMQKQAELQRASLSDPEKLKILAEMLKKFGAPNDRIVILPLEALAIPPR